LHIDYGMTNLSPSVRGCVSFVQHVTHDHKPTETG